MVSDAGESHLRRRRDSDLVLYLLDMFCFMFSLQFQLFKLSRTFYPYALLQAKSFPITKLPFFRSGSVHISLEESSHLVSLMARDTSLGPSDAPCQVESSTAHGDPIFWLMSTWLSDMTVAINLGSSLTQNQVQSKSKDSRTFVILVVPCLYRIPLKSILSSPRSLMEGSSALTSEPVKTLTAEGSTLPSSSSIVSGPYTCGGVSNSFSKEATLGFSILGLSPYFGPLILFRPKTTNFSPTTLLSRPRSVYVISSSSPFTCYVWFHGLFRRSLCSCSEVLNDIWRCAYSLQTLFLNRLRTTTIDVIMFFKSRIMAYLVLLFGNQLRLSCCVTPDTSSSIIIFIDYHLKHLDTDSVQRPQPEDVSALLLLQFSRTVANCSQQISKAQFRISFLPDLEGPRRPSFPVVERTSAPPSSFMERNQTKFLVVPSCFAPASHKAKYPYSTSRTLLIVTSSKTLELFAEVSLTHHNLACDMLLTSLCLRVHGPIFKAFHLSFLFDANLYSKILYSLFSPLLG